MRTLFVDIHSQHQTYTFLQPQYHINLLDSYGKEDYGHLLKEYKDEFKIYETLIKQFEDSKNCANATESQIEFLKFEINEIEEANIQSADEEEELNKELEILENAEKLKELTGSSYWAINGDDGSILEAMSQIKMDISKAANFDSSLEEVSQQFVDALENLKDISSTLRDYSQNLENDTQRLNDIQERLFIFDKLKRKYGGTLESVLKAIMNSVKNFQLLNFQPKTLKSLKKRLKSKKKN